ncbi:MAG: MBOAT family O-acyltransferase [Oscillospiraceae bacterium]
MVFSSTTFLFIFLPAVLILYYLIPEKHCRNALLILASLLFYAYNEPFVVGMLLLSILSNYAFGLMMKGKKHIRIMGLIFSIFWNLELLYLYQYAGFFAGILNHLPFFNIPVPEVKLPIGISIFTLQAMSYVIDVYRGKAQIQNNPFRLYLSIALFPQLLAGPIVQYHDIENQLTERTVNFKQMARGIRRFIIGLAKKLLIADTIGLMADSAFAMENEKIIFSYAWMGAICYTLQIYFALSGYSDMAIGLGKMFGFQYKENFNYPYFSKSITGFWKRWNISLSAWFQRYVYFPLGGNRKGNVRMLCNLLITYLGIGLWYGASWNFVIWGLWNGFFLILEFFMAKGNFPKNPLLAILKRFYCMGITVLGFVIFRAEDMQQAFAFWRAMFGFSPADVAQKQASFGLMTFQCNSLFVITMIFAVVFVMPVNPWLKQLLQNANPPTQKRVSILSYAGSMVLFGICLLYLASGESRPLVGLNF